MKKHVIFILALFAFTIGHSQILEPVKWSTLVKKISNSEYELVAIANIDDKWHLYSQTVPEGGPVSTQFSFEGNNKYLKKGNTKEEEGVIVHDVTFNMKVKYFENKAKFTQRIKLKSKPPFTINSEVSYMVCDDSKCIMPDPAILVFNLQ
ncbi:protein-disulfide reductase DsbD domain-containing protein [Algibacter sp. PT7-4]|uniref:protein-disulfide reductase DsbD domain-containing protein n=1 Tax=Algibacter ulvanivorans TaxID=3400999 RepID=UPI003AABD26B